MMGADAVRGHARGRDLPERGASRAARHRRAGRRAAVGPPRRRRPRPLRGRAAARRTTRSLDMDQVVLTPAHRRRHLRHRGQPLVDDRRRRRPAAPGRATRSTAPTRRCCHDRYRCRPSRRTATARGAAAVLAAAKKMLRARASSRARPATSRAGSTTARVVLTPSSLSYEDDDARRPRAVTSTATSSRASARRPARSPCTSRRSPPTPRSAAVVHCHAMYASMFAVAHRADPRGDRRVRHLHRRRGPVCDYHQSGSDGLGDRGRRAARATGQPR